MYIINCSGLVCTVINNDDITYIIQVCCFFPDLKSQKLEQCHIISNDKDYHVCHCRGTIYFANLSLNFLYKYSTFGLNLECVLMYMVSILSTRLTALTGALVIFTHCDIYIPTTCLSKDKNIS